MLIDTHTHLHFDAFAGEVDAVLLRAREAGVGAFINVGVTTADSLKAVELAAQYEGVWAAAGIHPHDAGEAEQGMGYLRELATRRKVVAIGECGLDLYKSTTSLEEQTVALRGQIELALELDLPLIFHVREAFEPFWQILDAYPEVRGVVHCFSAGPAELEAALERELHLALGGIMTFTQDAEQLKAAAAVPLDHLLLETDCPFLSPAPHRGKRNEPARLVDIAASVARLRGETVAELAVATTRNAERLFRLGGA